MRFLATSALLAATLAVPSAGQVPDGTAANAPAGTAPRLPGFAAILAQRPPIVGSRGWTPLSDGTAWQALARSTPVTRQANRWAFAVGLIAGNRTPEALGVLQVMSQDDPDLDLVPAFQLARGAALTALDRPGPALALLATPELGQNPEACAWRLRALERTGDNARALGQVACALAAINGRAPNARSPFIFAAVRSALTLGLQRQAQTWLGLLGKDDAEANLLRGRALLADGKGSAARQRFESASTQGTPEQRASARVGLVAAAISEHRIAPAEAIHRLDAIRFGWRGGDVEQRALRLSFAQADGSHDDATLLRTGATLVRYFNMGTETPTIMARLQTAMAAMLEPNSTVPLPQVAGMFWEYRELAPAGAAGDLMVVHLADRLEAAGLYTRAAELLQYQLSARTTDVAQGPLSVKVATLRIIAGDADAALQTLRETEGPTYSQDMLWDRKRLEAVALSQLGKTDAALAALDDVPGGGALRAEILWRRHDWEGFIATTAPTLPKGQALDEVGQAIVLRHAIALATLGRELQLQALHARYAAAFSKLPSAAAFNVLTQPIAAIDPARISAAMAAIPAASPAGAIADLLDAAPAGDTAARRK